MTLQDAFFLLPSEDTAMIVAVPAFLQDTDPLLSTEATSVLLLFHTKALLEVFEGETDAFNLQLDPAFTVILLLLSFTFETFTVFLFTVTMQV